MINTQARSVTSKTVRIGTVYTHRLNGSDWRVQVSAVFKDRHRFGWEGIVTQDCAGVETGSKCWGWLDELRERDIS